MTFAVFKTEKDFKKGTQFIITSKPTIWSSYLNDNNPLKSNIKYPYKSTIIEIKHTDHMAMTDGFYGWSLTDLIDDGRIEIVNIKEERKKKLIKIYGI